MPLSTTPRRAGSRPGTLVVTPAPDLPITLGKAMAQAGHAGMIAGRAAGRRRPFGAA